MHLLLLSLNPHSSAEGVSNFLLYMVLLGFNGLPQSAQLDGDRAGIHIPPTWGWSLQPSCNLVKPTSLGVPTLCQSQQRENDEDAGMSLQQDLL